jgi:AraC-like DNA-binding protein
VAATVVAALTDMLLRSGSALGLDAAMLLAESDLRAEDLQDPDGRIPLEVHARLWEAIAAHGPDDVGLRIGERFRPPALGAVGHALELAPTLGEVARTFERFRRLIFADGDAEIRVVNGKARFALTLPPPLARLRHPAEAAAAATITLLRTRVHSAVPSRVAFQHPAPPRVERHCTVFGVCPSFGAAANEMVFPASLLNARNTHANPATHRYLVRRAEELAAQIRDDGPIVERVRQALRLEMQQGEPRAEAVATRLAVSTRTLHRRLATEGTSLATLLDDLRRERALLLVADPERGLAEIARELGYGDGSTFGRAFRRWTGMTPGAFRQTRPASHRLPHVARPAGPYRP